VQVGLFVKKYEVIKTIFQNDALPMMPKHKEAEGFAPTNIALCKYWGKRDRDINLPVTSSLSVTLPNKGSTTRLSMAEDGMDHIVLNGEKILDDSQFYLRTVDYLNLFRPRSNWHLNIDITMNIPVAAGLASSACGFASLLFALKNLFQWKLNKRELSILARLGSGSACRSIWNGFVEWHAGIRADGMDSFGEPLYYEWPGLVLGILTVNANIKPISSREAMQRTVDSSVLYTAWPKKVAQDLSIIKQSLRVRSFSLLCGTAESNALAMHATMLSSWPTICYYLPETIALMHQIWDLRRHGLQIFFTQDAGPNLKIFFLEKDEKFVRAHFPTIEVIPLFVK
jgi:diphosphomevalonate decarboxylase